MKEDRGRWRNRQREAAAQATWRTTGLLLLSIACATALRAAPEPQQVAPAEEQVIVYIHPVATTVRVALDDLTLYETDSAAFGVWDYQFNLSSWLDVNPHRLEIKARFGSRDLAYCRFEVRTRRLDASAAATVLAEGTVRARDAEGSGDTTLLSLDIARPTGSVRPLWADPPQADLDAVTRSRSVDLVKDVFDALQGCQIDTLMSLVGPALTNQARMEGAPSELVKQGMRALLERDCIPGVAVADTRGNFHQAAYEDLMAPLPFEKLIYRFSRDETRDDKRGNLFTLRDPILIKTRDNRQFAARPYLSYVDGERRRRFVSRFIFERAR
jgi:hypothetical protein